MQTPAARPYFVTVGISVKTMTHNFAKISLWVENFMYELQKNIKFEDFCCYCLYLSFYCSIKNLFSFFLNFGEIKISHFVTLCGNSLLTCVALSKVSSSLAWPLLHSFLKSLEILNWFINTPTISTKISDNNAIV